LFAALSAATVPLALAQGGALVVPQSVEAGSAFSLQTAGSGKGTLYILGPDQVLKRDVELGQPVAFEAGSLYNAGHYVVVLSSGVSVDSGAFDVVSARKVADVTFLAKPSRLPVGLRDGITGAVYVFDAYQNLIVSPMPITFQLSTPSSAPQSRTVTSRNGAAWTAMDSTAHEGAGKFLARVGDISSERVIGQVPGDPCVLKMNAQPAGPTKIALETDPVRDCSGNAISDGTIVTFTEVYKDQQSTVDVPLKRGVAKVEMPARKGALITVASGVVLGNQIRWER
jgi:hypothetical protein